MIKTILSKPFAPIQKFIGRRRRKNIYLTRLEADFAKQCIQLAEMEKLLAKNWA